jgi:hypothetical protein
MKIGDKEALVILKCHDFDAFNGFSHGKPGNTWFNLP